MKRLFSSLLVLILAVSLFPSAFAEGADSSIRLNLNIVPSDGLGWEAVSDHPEIAYIDGDGFPADAAEDNSGLPLFAVLRVHGKKEGTADITFTFRDFRDETAEPVYSFTLKVSVDESLNPSLGGYVSLPEVSGFHWDVVQHNPDAIQITQDSTSEFALKALSDGKDPLFFILANEDRSETPCSFMYETSSKDGIVDIPVIWFSLSLPEELLSAYGVFSPAFQFETTDLDGNPVTEQILAGHSVTILNFWEPWCGPCVREMPDLQKISQYYADKGVAVIGIFATPDSDDAVRKVLEKTGVTYPIIRYASAFDYVQTGYVPTTVVLNSSGRIIIKPFSGSLEYNDWAGMLDSILEAIG